MKSIILLYNTSKIILIAIYLHARIKRNNNIVVCISMLCCLD